MELKNKNEAETPPPWTSPRTLRHPTKVIFTLRSTMATEPQRSRRGFFHCVLILSPEGEVRKYRRCICGLLYNLGCLTAVGISIIFETCLISFIYEVDNIFQRDAIPACGILKVEKTQRDPE